MAHVYGFEFISKVEIKARGNCYNRMADEYARITKTGKLNSNF